MTKILVADGDPATRESLTQALAQYGYVTMEACNSVNICLKAISETPDIILLDIMMPVTN